MFEFFNKKIKGNQKEEQKIRDAVTEHVSAIEERIGQNSDSQDTIIDYKISEDTTLNDDVYLHRIINGYEGLKTIDDKARVGIEIQNYIGNRIRTLEEEEKELSKELDAYVNLETPLMMNEPRAYLVEKIIADKEGDEHPVTKSNLERYRTHLDGLENYIQFLKSNMEKIEKKVDVIALEKKVDSLRTEIDRLYNIIDQDSPEQN